MSKTKTTRTALKKVVWVKAGAILHTVSGRDSISRKGAAQCLRQWREFGFTIVCHTQQTGPAWCSGGRYIQRTYSVHTDGVQGEFCDAQLHTFNHYVEPA